MDLVEAAVPPRTRLRAILLAIVALIVVVAGALLGQLLLAPLVGTAMTNLPATPVGASLRQLVYLIAGFGPVYVLLALAVRVREKRGFGYLFRVPRIDALKSMLAGLAIGVALSSAPIALGVLTHQAVLTPAGAPYLALLIGLAALFFQSFAEELVFRGWLLPALQGSLGTIAALAISSLMFAVAHSLNPHVTAVQVLGLFLAAVVLGLLTLATRNIWAAGLAHALWNWVQYQGVALDGEQPKVGALFVARHPMGGAAFGGRELESTTEFAICIVLLLVAIGLASRRRVFRPGAVPVGESMSAIS